MRKAVLVFMSLLVLTGVAVAGCAQPAAPAEEVPPPDDGETGLSVASPAFEEGERFLTSTPATVRTSHRRLAGAVCRQEPIRSS